MAKMINNTGLLGRRAEQLTQHQQEVGSTLATSDLFGNHRDKKNTNKYPDIFSESQEAAEQMRRSPRHRPNRLI